jgi:hypothetical protein
MFDFGPTPIEVWPQQLLHLPHEVGEGGSGEQDLQYHVQSD